MFEPIRLITDLVKGLVIIDYRGRSLTFSVELYKEGKSAKTLAMTSNPFEVLNMYLATIPDHEQEILFDAYHRAKIILDDTLNLEELQSKLTALITEMSQTFTIDKFKSWYGFKSNIPIPPDLKENLSDIEDPSLATEVQTYLRSDYIGLCGLSLAMTMLSPIFSDFVSRTKTEFGKVWKMYYAYLLMDGSTYMSHPDFDRLYRYVEATLNTTKDVNFNSVIISGISRDEYVNWLMGVVITKRVACGNISGYGPALIMVVYKYIMQRAGTLEKDFYGPVNVRQSKEGSSDEDTVSRLEMYTPRQTIGDNLIVISEVFLSDPFTVAKKLDPTIPDSLIKESLSTAYMMNEGDLEDGPITILKWTINRLVSARMIDYINRESVTSAILAARAYLWYRGHYDLAALVSALPIENRSVHMVTGVNRRNRVVTDLSERIDQVYPYYKDNTAAKKGKLLKGAQVSAEHLESILNKNDWYLTLPDKWIEEGKLNTQSRHYALEDDIKISLILYALEIADQPILNSPI